MRELHNTNKVVMAQRSFDYYNKLLEIDFDDNSEEMQEKIEKLNAYRNDIIFIGKFEFEDNRTITYELISGDSNYYDSLILCDEDNYDLSYHDGVDYEVKPKLEFCYEDCVSGEETLYICDIDIIKENEDLFYCNEWDMFYEQDLIIENENKVMQVIAIDNNKVVCYKKIDKKDIRRYRVGVERLDKNNIPYEHLEYEETRDIEEAYTYYSNWNTWDTKGLGKYLIAVLESGEEVVLQQVGYYEKKEELN